ncbi:MAG: arsenite methyltransferase [Tenuifilaceae bacterium]
MNNKNETSSLDYFEKHANEWDSMRESFFSENIREKAIAKANIKKGETAADIGAGTGYISEALNKKGIKVYAVDESPAMLKVLHERLGENIATLIGTSEKIPLLDSSVNHAFANMYLHHVPDPEKAIAEMARIVKPGGSVVITDLDEHNFEFLKTEQNDRWLGFKRSDIKDWFLKAGLTNISIENTDDSCCSDSNCGCTPAKISVFLAYGKKPSKDITLDADSIKASVSSIYSTIAKSNTSCCGTKKSSCCSNDAPYNAFAKSYQDQPGYNADADLNLGCGIPTEIANIQQGETVVDLGSGAGNDCFVARALVGETGRVIGVDFTDAMLEKAKQNNQKMGYKNVEFVKGDIEKMPLENGIANVVLSNCVINLVPDKQKAFNEIFRILKSGGRFCISDIIVEGEMPEDVRKDAALYAGCVSGAISKAKYIEYIHNSGFTNISTPKVSKYKLDELIGDEYSQKFSEMNFEVYSITFTADKS